MNIDIIDRGPLDPLFYEIKENYLGQHVWGFLYTRHSGYGTYISDYIRRHVNAVKKFNEEL